MRNPPPARIPVVLALLALLLAACASAVVSEASFPTVEARLTATPDVRASVLQTPASPLPPGLPAAPYELHAGQHISAGGSYTETETAAAGPMVCQVARGSCAFGYLVRAEIPGLLFLNEERPPYNDEDSLVHAAMLQPLARLVELVAAEWDGEYQVMVTDAYDSRLEHDLAQNDPERKYSLHFEGRSVDLILVPLGLQRMARLCALAHAAGFDWAHNEGDHCHASVRADSLCHICSGRLEPAPNP